MSSEYAPVTKKPNIKRILILSTVVIIALPLVIFAFVAMQGLFVRAEDLMPHDVVVSSISKSSATISWKTDAKTQTVIEYGSSPNTLNFYAPEQSPRKDHSIELTLLTSSTPYYFRMKTGNNTYDNGGMPWTFTTKSSTGQDVSEQVRGISTRISKVTATPTQVPLVCTAKTCDEIQNMLGKGCTAADYVKCIAGTPQPSGTAKTTVVPTSPTVIISTPVPTGITIQSNLCKLEYLQGGSSDCTKWLWGPSMDAQEPACKKAFYRYVIECKKKDFSSEGGQLGTWAVYDIGSPTYTIDADAYDINSGDTIYCRVRAEDKNGNGTEWQNNIEPKKCS